MNVDEYPGDLYLHLILRECGVDLTVSQLRDRMDQQIMHGDSPKRVLQDILSRITDEQLPDVELELLISLVLSLWNHRVSRLSN